MCTPGAGWSYTRPFGWSRYDRVDHVELLQIIECLVWVVVNCEISPVGLDSV